MKIEEGIAAREYLLLHEGRDLLRDGAARVAWKGPVEVQSIDRRGPLPRHYCVDIVGRHQDQPALDITRLEVADQFGDGDRTFVLVAMVAALEDDRRPFAIGDHGERQTGWVSSPPTVSDLATGASQPAAPARGAATSSGDPADRGVMRPLPVHSLFLTALPITPEEIHKVLAALGPDLAAIFDEEA